MRNEKKDLVVETFGYERKNKPPVRTYSKGGSTRQYSGARSTGRRRAKKRRERRIRIAILSILILAALCLVLLITNRYEIKFNVKDGSEVNFEYGSDFSEVSGVKAYYTGTIFKFVHKDVPVTVNSDTNFTELGDYRVTYTAEYKGIREKVTQTVHVQDTTAPDIQLKGESCHSPGYEYIEEGFTATDNFDGDLTAQVKREISATKIVYTVTDSNGNEAKVTRNLEEKDVVAPVITLEGDEKVYISKGGKFSEPGYTCIDDVDGDITSKVEVSGDIDSSKYGPNVLTYTVKDSAGNVASVERRVVVPDPTAPELTLKGDERMFLSAGKDEYTEPGYTATDKEDGDVTDKVQVIGEVDTSKPGVYSLKYVAMDASENETVKIRTVFVASDKVEFETVDPGEKVVYLTFDDGPGPYTEKLLDILDKYQVKATFFVTDQYGKKYRDIIGEEYRRGHTVALHSYSHTYEKIYKSEDAYYDDISKLSAICYEQTGVTPTILRFPGGTSNTISRHASKGIMAALSESVGKYGYQYTDWNITSGDAGETTETSVVVQNVINGMRYNANNGKVSIVLQHDIKGFSVDAVEEIIKYGLDNGYTFLPLDMTSPMIHWRAQN